MPLTHRVLPAVLLIGAASLALSGCVAAAIDAAERDTPASSTNAPSEATESIDPTPTESDAPDNAGVSERETIDAWSLRVGHCFDDDTSSEEYFTEIEVIPCGEAHDNEIYSQFDLPDGAFPGDDAVVEAADEGCGAEFESFIGVPFRDSQLDYWSMYPDTTTWNQLDDREVVCIAYDPAGPVTGSLKDAGR